MFNVNVIGYGQIGRQTASLFCLLGCSVTVWNRHAPDANEVAKQLKLTAKLLGMPLTANTIHIADSLKELNQQAITIESVVEDIAVKKAIFAQCKDLFINNYYTSSSSFSPSEIGNEAGGLHFFNPIGLKLVEYCQPKIKTDSRIDELLALLEQQQFHIAAVHANRGYIANSILVREIANVFMLMEQRGYTLAEIDIIYHALQRNDVFSLIDVAGTDTVYAVLENLHAEDKSIYLPSYIKIAINNNVLGKKNKTSIRRFLAEIESCPGLFSG